MHFEIDQGACRRLKHRALGKRILFTDRSDLSDAEIVFGYRAQHHVERAFKDMKDPYFISFSPPLHWTGPMIRVHAFYCVLALTLVAVLHRRVHQAGIQMGKKRLVEELKRLGKSAITTRHRVRKPFISEGVHVQSGHSPA